MLKIGVVGYTGKVNKYIIDEVLSHQDCALSGVLVRSDKLQQEQPFKLYDNILDLANESDAIIDFSAPELSVEIAKQLVKSKTILVSGTTGFTQQEFQNFQSYSDQLTIIWSANMSIGINLLQSLLKVTAAKLGTDFDAAIIETHRRHKKDSPSGTALMLAKTIESIHPETKVQISSLRLGDNPAEHTVIFGGANESMTLSHRALDRNVFAKGAIAACFWGQNKEAGLYSMQDVLN